MQIEMANLKEIKQLLNVRMVVNAKLENVYQLLILQNLLETRLNLSSIVIANFIIKLIPL